MEWLKDNYMLLIDLALYTISLVMIYFFTKKILIRKNIKFGILTVYVAKIVSSLFGFSALSSLTDVCLIAIIVALLLANDQIVKNYLARKGKFRKQSDLNVEERYDLYRKVSDAVQMLSQNKIGAIMTFERDTNLDDYIKNGVRISVPVTTAIITTIFYPGTTLHDGAMIIRGNTIEAASVFYTPTTRALNGKYGARHRASLGISEVSDAITVVVSEETGRVSFAINGELQAVGRDVFYQTFKDLMEK